MKKLTAKQALYQVGYIFHNYPKLWTCRANARDKFHVPVVTSSKKARKFCAKGLLFRMLDEDLIDIETVCICSRLFYMNTHSSLVSVNDYHGREAIADACIAVSELMD